MGWKKWATFSKIEQTKKDMKPGPWKEDLAVKWDHFAHFKMALRHVHTARHPLQKLLIPINNTQPLSQRRGKS